MLYLKDPFLDGVGTMELSGPIDDAPTSLVHSASYNPWGITTYSQGQFAGCTANITEAGVASNLLTDSELLKQEGWQVFAVGDGIVRTRFDGRKGFSGSPLWWCPDGSGGYSCDGDETGHLLGVWSSFNNVNNLSDDSASEAVSVYARGTWIGNHRIPPP